MTAARYFDLLREMKESIYNHRLRLVESARARGIKPTARLFATTVPTVRKWLRRYQQQGPSGLLARSRARHRQPHKTPPGREAQLLELRKTLPTFGSRRLIREFDLPISHGALERIWRQHGLLKKRRRKYQRKQDLAHIKAQWALFQQISADTKDLDDIPRYWVQAQRLKLPVVQYTAREVRSGLLFWAFAEGRSASASAIFASRIQQHLDRYGVSLRDLVWQTDNGGEFKGDFPKALGDSQHVRIPPAAHTYQSDVETVHRLEEDEFFDLEDFSSRGDFLAKVHTYQLYFNLVRPNSHKQNQSPWQIIERLAPRSPLQLCLLPPVFLDYHLNPSGGYHVPRLPYVSPGVHQCAVVFVTRQGFWTAPSPPLSWTAAGGHQVSVTNIPIGPSNVVQRLVAFTASGGASFYHVPSTMVINDNTTTSLTVDFTDSILLSGTSVDYLFNQIELPEQLGVVAYAERLFWWGERANMDNWCNLTFDGGWDASGSGRPLGWQLDPSFGAGGSREPSNVVWGDAYRITADGITAARGMVFQNAITDAEGNPLLANNTDYSVRARIARSSALAAGTLRINAYSPTMGQLSTGLAVSFSQATALYQEFTADLLTPQISLPSDLTLRVYADGVPAPSGESFLIDNIEIFPTNNPRNSSLVRASGTESPEAYDGVTGVMSIAENNGQGIRAAFVLRNNLYFVKERSLYVTATDGVNEPVLWAVEEVSNQVGTPSAHGIGVGEEWAVIAGRSGLYLFSGGNPIKISQEIQPTWDNINWSAGQTLWVQVDVQHKRILIGVPTGSATQPSEILMLDYTEGFGDPLVGSGENSRKWSPWKIAANSCGLIERPGGTAQIFLGSNNSNGKIYALTPGTFSDDGNAINSYYTTAFLSKTGLSGRNLFGFLTAYVQGSGALAVTAEYPGDSASVSLGTWALSSPASRDSELFTNILAERAAYQFGTNSTGSWFSMTKFVPWAKPDPFSIVRGIN